MLRILLVEDHILFREGLVTLLNAQPDFSVVGQAGSVQEAIAMAQELEPDLVLMDFGLPDGTGLDATQVILTNSPETKIVFLTVHEEDEWLFAAIRCGAKGYLPKNLSVSELLIFLRGVERGKAAISPAMMVRVLEEFACLERMNKSGRTPLGKLTSRQLEVFQELATGATNHEIADRLIITENTVKRHVHIILTKLNLRNRREAATFARRQRLVSSSFDYL